MCIIPINVGTCNLIFNKIIQTPSITPFCNRLKKIIFMPNKHIHQIYLPNCLNFAKNIVNYYAH
ncbi:hypothetical protein HMPREF9370_1839 [Neisseria wadsworthii 9715]|uniref:Uncharacterized protein n=1 Tax=Neisseria wadsworthii 9715 TaxID=1030841 RepID=G4CRX9_9NEIS|nr:hypothetical protein HMPREF9370_1839 [Neisseria wadsworthii 9715]